MKKEKNNQLLKSRVVMLFALFVFSVAVSATQGDGLVPERAPDIKPLYNLSCDKINYEMADGKEGVSIYDSIYSYDLCYKDFLNNGWDEFICGKYSQQELTWTTPPAIESQTQSCYIGFAIAKRNYKICDNLRTSLVEGSKIFARDRCFNDVALISNNIEPCTVIDSDSERDFCFALVGPTFKFEWVSWFLSRIFLSFIIISLILFISISISLKSVHKKKLILFSLIVAFIQSIVFLMFILTKKIGTGELIVLVLLPISSLFFSAFAIKGIEIISEKAGKRKIIVLASMLLIGFIHGFLTPILPFYKAYGFDIFEWGGIFFVSFADSVLFVLMYLVFYFSVIRKNEKGDR